MPLRNPPQLHPKPRQLHKPADVGCLRCWIVGSTAPKKEERAGQHLDAAVEDVKALPTKLLRGQLHHASAEGCPNEARPRRVLTGTTAMSGLPLKLQLPNQSNPYSPKPSSNEITLGRSRTAREYEPPRRKGASRRYAILGKCSRVQTMPLSTPLSLYETLDQTHSDMKQRSDGTTCTALAKGAEFEVRHSMHHAADRMHLS